MKAYVTILLCFFVSKAFPQVFWTETFNNGCPSGCTAAGVNTGNGPWSIDLSGGCNDSFANVWYVSCAENGNAAGTCGSGCGANATLHMGSTTLGDIGAAYDAGGLGGCGSGGTFTFARAVSPLISTVGKTGISVTFDYIENGDGAIDDGWVEYSTNGGATWTLLVNTPKTACCGGPCVGTNQGKWTNYNSAVLPATANNNPSFMLRFVWTNNDDGIGTDPSYAINDVKLKYTTILPVELTNFSASVNDNAVVLQWITATEKNSDHFEIQKSGNGSDFTFVGKVMASRNSDHTQYYSFKDFERNTALVYYRLKMVDINGDYQYSTILALDANSDFSFNADHFINAAGQLEINKNYVQANNFESLNILNTEGKIMNSYPLSEYTSGDKIIIPTTNLVSGLYLCQMRGYSNQKSFKFFISQ
jgi:hypothetical protein